MKVRIIFWLSMAVNLALAIALLFLARQHPAAIPDDSVAPMASRPAQPDSPTVPGHAPIPGPSWPPFRWNQIAADDLKVYRENLLAVGCPDSTVRDIILAEINERFGPRRQGLLGGLQSQVWEILAARQFPNLRGGVHAAWALPLEQLALERQKMIDEVLGRNYSAEEAGMRERRYSMQERYSWLPTEKRDRLVALEEQHQQRMGEWAEVVGQRTDGSNEADNRKLEALQQEYELVRKELFTAQEFEEFRLRSSSAANWADELESFEPTEAEWRAVTKLKAAFDAEQSRLGEVEMSLEESTARQKELRDELDLAIREQLGPERFGQYELAGDNSFQQTRKITQRYGLPESTALRTLEVQREVTTQIQELRGRTDLSAEARQAALAAIHQETERTLVQTLGESAFSTYKEYNGGWLNELAF